MGNNKTALSFLKKSLEVGGQSSECNTDMNEANTYINIASVYSNVKKHATAGDFLARAIAILESLDDDDAMTALIIAKQNLGVELEAQGKRALSVQKY